MSSVSRRSSSVFSVWSLTSADCSHGERPVAVYCDTCSRPLCDLCVISAEHRRHVFKTVDDACTEQVDKLAKQLKGLVSEAKKQGNIQQWVKRQEEQFESDFKQTEESFTELYAELQELLEHNKKEVFKLLDAQRESQRKSLYCLLEDVENYRERTEALQTEIRSLEERVSSGERSVCVLQEIQVHQISIDTVHEFYKKATPKNKLDTSRLDALKKSVQHIAKETREIFPRPWEFYEDLTFNLDNTPKSLKICADQTQVVIIPNQTSTTVPALAEDTPVHILAKQSWRGGRHYWEVDVEKCHSWAVGVVELAEGKRLPAEVAERPLGRDRSSWVLESYAGELAAVHHDDFSTVKEQELRRLGVFLDMTKSKSRLTFYDVNSCSVLHTFYPRFKQNVFPVFSLSSTPGLNQSLALCNLDLNSQDADTWSDDSGVEISRSNSVASRVEASESQ